MRKFLSHDSETGELRLVYTDLWEGQHERTEYRVTSDRVGGHVLRNMTEWDGRPVLGAVPGLYVKAADGFGQIPVWTEETAIGPTIKTPCPKAASSRRKCALCAAE
jgi:outer membrane receptor for Fe3+-dicitrate